MQVWKYTLQIEDSQEISMPAGAQILTVQMQYGQLALWALVMPEAEPVSRTILMRGTGHGVDIALRLKYISTIQDLAGAIVWHFFEKIELED